MAPIALRFGMDSVSLSFASEFADPRTFRSARSRQTMPPGGIAGAARPILLDWLK